MAARQYRCIRPAQVGSLEDFAEALTETSYQAANWIRVGQTKGRRKLVRSHADALPVKDIDLCPWHRS